MSLLPRFLPLCPPWSLSMICSAPPKFGLCLISVTSVLFETYERSEPLALACTRAWRWSGPRLRHIYGSKRSIFWVWSRDKKKGLQILLSFSQAGPGRKAKQGPEEISHNHMQTFFLGSVLTYSCLRDCVKLAPLAWRRDHATFGKRKLLSWATISSKGHTDGISRIRMRKKPLLEI